MPVVAIISLAALVAAACGTYYLWKEYTKGEKTIDQKREILKAVIILSHPLRSLKESLCGSIDHVNEDGINAKYEAFLNLLDDYEDKPSELTISVLRAFIGENIC